MWQVILKAILTSAANHYLSKNDVAAIEAVKKQILEKIDMMITETPSAGLTKLRFWIDLVL